MEKPINMSTFQQVNRNKLTYWGCQKEVNKKIKAYGLLVLLGFDVTIFTPIAYQRHSL